MARRRDDGMRNLEAVRLKAWTLPFIVAALILPVVGAAWLLGPPGAFGAGFLTTATVAILAIRARYEEEIQVERSADGAHRAVVVCLAPLDSAATAQRVAELIRTQSERFQAGGRSLVLTPAYNTPLAEWLSDVDVARSRARQQMERSVALLQEAGLDVDGRVGEPDVVQTVADILPGFPANDLILVVAEPRDSAIEVELRRRLDRPIHVVTN